MKTTLKQMKERIGEPDSGEITTRVIHLPNDPIKIKIQTFEWECGCRAERTSKHDLVKVHMCKYHYLKEAPTMKRF